MIFEYDINKSNANKQKHGIDFEEVKLLWEDDNLLQLKGTFEEEQRFLNIGKVKDKFYTVITTFRGDKIRIISARRSREKEIKAYES